MEANQTGAKEYIAEMIERARRAQMIADGFSQEKVDELAGAIAWEFVSNPELVREIAQFSFDECRLGDYASKVAKIEGKVRSVYYDVKHEKTVGVVEEILERGLTRIAKPIGVIGSLVPSTQAEMHPILQAINVVKSRNAIIFSPHPRGAKTTMKICHILQNIVERYDAPREMFLCVEKPSIEKTNELMRQCDLIIATGGADMVRAAYSSGTPAYGVGAGNATIIVDKSANLTQAAQKIKASKTFDLAAGCSCDNALIIDETIYDDMLEELKKVHAYITTSDEKEKIQRAIWPNWPSDHMLNRDVVASPVSNIARIAGIMVPDETCMILVEEDKTGIITPFAGEKMCLVITVYKSKGIDDAIRITNENLSYSGAGHSCGIYTSEDENVSALSLRTHTTRVVVNQPQALTNTGSWVSGMPATSSLGCGTWGGNIVSENISLKHYMNNTWVIREIPNFKPTDDELFTGFQPRTAQ